jgi:hypothetical protein
MNPVPRESDRVLIASPSQNRRVQNERSCTCRFCEGVMHFLRWFPTPMGLDASLRLLSDKVTGVFGRIIPYAMPIWNVVSYWHLFGLLAVAGMVFLAPSDNREDMEDAKKYLLFELGMVIAIVANTILLIGKTHIAPLAQFSSLTGQLSSWKGFLFELRNSAFLASFFLLADGSTHKPLEMMQHLLSMGVVCLSAAGGYDTFLGVLALMAATCGVYEFCSEGSGRN